MVWDYPGTLWKHSRAQFSMYNFDFLTPDFAQPVTGKFPFKEDVFAGQKGGDNYVGSPIMRRISDRLMKFEIDFSLDPFPYEPELGYL